MHRIRFVLNDRPVELEGVAPTTTLLRWLRDHAHLTGTKEGCAEGDCGACTVAVLEEAPSGEQTWRAVNACLVLLPMVQGKRLYTVEGLRTNGEHHPAQTAMANNLGSQCGYCTPGVVMSMFEATYRRDLDEDWKLDAQMCGNLCRCTGYRPIRDAAKEVAGTCPEDRFQAALSQPMPEDAMKLRYAAGAQRYFNPTSFEELWDVLDAEPAARFVLGGTDLSLEITKRFVEPEVLVSLEGIRALKGITSYEGEGEGGYRIGAGTCLSDLEDWSRGKLTPLERMLRYFGARAIKNRGTVGGNLCNASPIGDLPPVLISLGATAVLRSREGERRMPLEEFFISYRKTALRPKEILSAVEVPVLPANVRASAYKVSKRRELDISAVSAGFVVTLDAEGKVSGARLAYGGMAATPARAKHTEAALIGKTWSDALVREAAKQLEQDFKPMSDHRGSAPYRAMVARNLLIGFHEETAKDPVPRLQWPHTATVEVA